MEKIISQTLQFLKTNKLNEEAIDMNAQLEAFLKEMKRGLAKDKDGSLAMIPTYTKADAEIKCGDKVIVLDAGGTNFRVALVTFDESLNAVFSYFTKTGMPGVHHEVSSSEFFSTLADGVEPIINESDYIGFCFSYAATITPDRDGIPVVFSKEIKAPEVIGKPVGATLLKELARRGHNVSNKKVAVLNDTVATLLAGKVSKDAHNYSSFIGFILGTGTNTAYIEQNEAITKIPSLPSGSQIVNVESGNYNLTVGPIDDQFFETTKNPPIYHFEKMISGAYLGSFSRLVIEKAIGEGVLSKEFGYRYEKIEPINTTRMSHYLEMPLNEEYDLVTCITNEEDGLALHMILDAIIRRAAKLTAINLSAAVLSTRAGVNPRHPVLINADGTTFYKTEKLEFYTRLYLDLFLTREHHRYFKIVQIDNSPILGAAVAPLV